MHPKVGGAAVDTELREDVVTQIPIEGVFFGKMSKVFHDCSARLLNEKYHQADWMARTIRPKIIDKMTE
jgi:hypothetical protein